MGRPFQSWELSGVFPDREFIGRWMNILEQDHKNDA
jgi:hypothetical protein